MVSVDGQGIPLGVHLSPANRAESQLAEDMLAQVAVPRAGDGRPKQKPQRIIADRGYDCHPSRQLLKRRGIQLIVPHLSNRTYRYQDGRSFRRYRRRWISERTNAWLHNFRHLVTRYDNKIEHYRSFLYAACMLITLRQF
jgi:transposase